VVFGFGVSFDGNGVQLVLLSLAKVDEKIDLVRIDDLLFYFCPETKIAPVEIERADVGVIL